MKKNINGENLFVIFSLILIAGVILFIVISAFTSNNYFYNNTTTDTSSIKSSPNNASTNSNNTSSTNTNENLNVSDETINKANEAKTEENINTNTNIPKTLTETEIASYTTSIYDKDENRVFNITKATQILNDTIIKSGEEFSFNNYIGPMDEQSGYKKALGFDTNGNKIQIAGGGMCQISSTLYNSALIANLEITERHPHSRRVYYVPKDKDATIFYNTLDLKFKNNTNYDIKIIATNDSSNVTIKLIQLS